MLVPLVHARIQDRIYVVGAAAVASGQRPLPANLAEPLDQIEPGRRFGQGHEVDAGMAPIPEHRLQRPMQRQRVDDEIGRARWGKRLEPIQELQLRGGITRGCSIVVAVYRNTCPLRCATAQRPSGS